MPASTRSFTRARSQADNAEAAERAKASASAGRTVDRPAFIKASLVFSRSIREGVADSRSWWDGAEAASAAGLPLPSSASHSRPPSVPPSPPSQPSVSRSLDPAALASRLAGLQTDTAKPGRTALRPERRQPLKRQHAAISGADAESSTSMSKNAKRKKIKIEAAQAGEGEYHERARKQPRPNGEQAPANRRRTDRRHDNAEYARAHPWSPQKRDAFFERPRQFRYVLLEEGREIKLAVSQNGAYVGGNGRDWGPGCDVSEEEAAAAGLVKVPYDGSDTLLLLDDDDIIFGVFAPPPKEKAPRQPPSSAPQATPTSAADPLPDSGPPFDEPVSFAEMCAAVVALFKQAEQLQAALPTGGRRGPFTAVNVGLQSGMSHPPHTLAVPPGGEEFVKKLLASKDLQRLARWQSELLAHWSPLNYHHTRCKLKRLHEETGLRPPFPNSVYPTACANCGKHTVCAAHRDKTNYPCCMCCITALGNFDATKGGHMALPELGIYVPFPPGTTCLISSAAMIHGNTGVQENEIRHSFTQYCPGGLIRWVSYGFQPVKGLSDAQRAKVDEAEGEGWEAQHARFSNVWEVDEHRVWVREQERIELEEELARAKQSGDGS